MLERYCGKAKALRADLIFEQLEERIVLDGTWDDPAGDYFDDYELRDLGGGVEVSYWRHPDGGGGYDALFAFNHSTGQWYQHDGPSTSAYGIGNWYALGNSGQPSPEGRPAAAMSIAG